MPPVSERDLINCSVNIIKNIRSRKKHHCVGLDSFHNLALRSRIPKNYNAYCSTPFYLMHVSHFNTNPDTDSENCNKDEDQNHNVE